MDIRAIILDIDGTLVDTNPAHVEAWRRTFQRFGYDVPADRIVVEIGKGGDKLIPSVLGQEVEKREGEALRKAQKKEFLAIAESERFPVFPGVEELFQALRERSIRSALATSSDEKHLEATLASAGLDLRELADVVVTRSPNEASKPAPDLVLAAIEELRLPAQQCAMIGDTVYDGQACQAAGVVFLGVLTGPATEDELIQAGARAVWRDVAHLLTEIDRALDIASATVAASE
ncbi:MAG TPA: HAD family hydrolase [Gemmatimonadales bacterium]|nr:HAD family hydrolase [Gemmatimonadales bacterium]